MRLPSLCVSLEQLVKQTSELHHGSGFASGFTSGWPRSGSHNARSLPALANDAALGLNATARLGPAWCPSRLRAGVSVRGGPGGIGSRSMLRSKTWILPSIDPVRQHVSPDLQIKPA